MADCRLAAPEPHLVRPPKTARLINVILPRLEREMLSTKNFGRKSLDEIKDVKAV